MHGNRLVTGLVGAFGLMTVILLVGGIVDSPALLALALVFGGITVILYYHASGRLLNRIYRSVEQRAATGGSSPGSGGFGAGPREEWTPPRDQQRRQRARRQRQQNTGRQRQQVQQSRLSRREAAQILGVGRSADQSTVKQAYRERIKEVHPDTDDGDQAEFKRVQEAYEVLQE